MRKCAAIRKAINLCFDSVNQAVISLFIFVKGHYTISKFSSLENIEGGFREEGKEKVIYLVDSFLYYVSSKRNLVVI